MTNYWDPVFINHLRDEKIRIVCEVGARYGDESIKLSETFPEAQLLSFECNPNTINICRRKLAKYPHIKFFPVGLGNQEEQLPFYSYTQSNDGASSLLKRTDFHQTQQLTGYIDIRTLSSIMNDENISHIDLLCMDVQGYELNVLKGCGDFLSHIKFIIMEEPKPIINTTYLSDGTHSKYMGAPSSSEIHSFITKNGFVEIARISENMIEDNVMYKRA
jgi:FkbM family methyltransferase